MSSAIAGGRAETRQNLTESRSVLIGVVRTFCLRRTFKAKVLTATALCTAFGGFAVEARAQAPTATDQSPVASITAGTSPTTPNLGEVVVTATKRDQLLRNIPATVDAVTGAQLAAAGPIINTGDILATVPGVRFNDLTGSINSEISIRGSGTERATGADPAVGLFANGVYIGAEGRNFNLLDSFDLNRAEILSGPQGALYGRNSEYGVINLISQEPLYKDSLYIDDAYTTETHNNRFTVVANHPVNDQIAIRLGIEDIQQSRGFVYDPDSRSFFDTTEGVMGRAQIHYRNEKLDVNLMAETQQLGVPAQYSGYDVSPTSPIATLPLGFTQPKYTLAQSGLNQVHENINSLVLSVNYDFGWAKLTSTSSYRGLRTDNDNGGNIDLQTAAALEAQDLAAVTAGTLTQAKAKSLYPLGQSDAKSYVDDFYEDIHLGGAAFESKFNWLAGFDFLQSSSVTNTVAQANPCATAANAQPADGTGGAAKGAFPGICAGTPTMPVCDQLLSNSSACPSPFPYIPGTTISNFGYSAHEAGNYQSLAPYASLSYKIGWGFTISGDVRYTNDHKGATQNVNQLYYTTPYNFTAGGQILPRDYLFNSSRYSYTGTISYKIPGFWNDIVYAKFGDGYRAGGFNFGDSPLPVNGVFPVEKLAPPVGYAPVVSSYGDETTKSYEVGLKGGLTKFVYFTFDAYTSSTANALTAVGDGCAANNTCETGNTNYTVNGGTVHAAGIEAAFDTRLHLFDGVFNFEATGSNQKATYSSVPTTFTGLPIVGTEVAQNPRWLASLTANYRHSLGANIEGFANVVYHAQWGGIQDTVTTGFPAIPLSNYENTDLRAGLRYKSVEFSVFIDNLSNETHKLAQFAQANLTYTTDRWSLPRVIGIEASYKW